MIEIKGEDITPNKDGGVLKEILKVGTGVGSPFEGANVYVHYTGTLLDGTKFDSSRDRNQEFSFNIGKGEVIKGWDIGIATMQRGELARFIIRSDYGYGEKGSGDKIPPNATLVFEVELFEFYGEDLSPDEDKSIVRQILIKGEGYATPNDGSRVVILLKGTYQERVFDIRELTFEIGEGSKVNIINGVEHALLKFKKGEISRLNIKSKHAWGTTGNEKFGIPPNADVIYEVNLKDFEKFKESWELDGKEKLGQSELLKSKGTALFMDGHYGLAVKKYNKIIDYLQLEKYTEPDDVTKSKQLLIAANLNIAACNLKLKNSVEAINACQKVLEIESNNEKALFRVAQAYLNQSEFDDAIKFFNRVLELYPNNKDAKAQISIAKQKLKDYAEKEKKLYAKMFSGATNA